MFTEKPKFSKEKIDFFREEKNGYHLVVVDSHPEVGNLLINSTSKEILEYFNGTRTVDDVLSCLSLKYPHIETKILLEDINNVLSRFSYLGIIDWGDSKNPYGVSYEQKVSDGYVMRVAEEKDVPAICEALKNLDNETQNENSLLSSYFDPKLYEHLALRTRMFQKMEEFFVLYDEKGILVNVLSIALPYYSKSSSGMMMLVKDISDVYHVEGLLNFTFMAARDVLVKRIEKITFLIREEKHNSIIATMQKVGFRQEAILKNETGSNTKDILWAYDY